MPLTRPSPLVLYFLLDLPGEQPREVVEGLLPRLAGAWGSFDLVQVRAKESGAAAYVEALERVRNVVMDEAGSRPRMMRRPEGLGRVEGSGRPLVLANDRVDVALSADADGVHVGADDLPPKGIRELELPPEFVVGLTCHTLQELQATPGRGADYIGLGSFFPSPTKPGPMPDPRPALHRLPADLALPIYAIGGIALERLPELAAEPLVRGVVVSSAIQSAPDPAVSARAFRESLNALVLRS